MRGIGGISPVIAKEAVCLATGAGAPLTPGRIVASLREVLNAVERGPYSPRIYQTPKGPVLAALRLEHMSGSPGQGFDTMNEAADAYYAGLIESQRFASIKAALLKDARTKLEAAHKKAEAIEADLAKSARADEYQLYGNLLMASPGAVADGADSVELPNLFAEDVGTVTIPLDPQLNTVKNAEAFFKKARKARAGAEILRSRLDAASREAVRLAARLKEIEEAEDADDLPESGASGEQKHGKVAGGRGKVSAPPFPSFTSSDGFEVLYGRNAKANDILTFKVADSMDLWLHAQGYHGSHVIVRNPERRPDIPLQTILEAAEVAAQFSEARKDTSVAVDYTFRKYVRKPRDPVPGQAIFTGNKTVFVTPRKH
ncbi:MAG: DUF814 domain-containing protein [Nitrospirae bacterium]|nr:DUF814 domain-containing protein [Nitrospirota bacterium]